MDRVYIDTQNEEGYLTRKGLVRSERTPRIGDKYSSRHGQKGTIGILLDGIDMPFNKYGIRPDIILNPNAIPSRMTIGQIVECLVGKAASLEGMDADGTPFEDHDIESVKDKLEKLGYERNGKEYLYNGMTGEKMKVAIFFGPTYYQRLKHLVEDKIHSRARGPKTSLTRQAPEGRSRDGGLRMGEMERDALLAHGLAKFIKEKLIDNSDPFTTYVCDKCGLFAQRFDKKENKSYATEDDVYYCASCNNHNDISKIKIPYAFKLFLHELTAMCIAPRIRCEKSAYE
jgi:DNA-directed RNA polymerase II subunit RPB2